MPVSTRRIAAGLVATGLVVAAACSPAGSGSGQPGNQETGGRQTFVVARTAALDLLDPSKATAFQTVQTLDLVYGTLLRTTPDGKLEPGLATEWKTSQGGRKITFTLRQGVTFHDGSAFTAADAKATLERILNEKTGSVVRSYFLDITKIATTGRHTLVLRLDQPNASLLYGLAQVGASMLDKQDISADTVAREPNGTGPFRWGSRDKGQRVALEANDQWWGGDLELDSIEFRVIPDESSILSGMKAGSFNLGIISDPNIAQQAKGSSVRLVSQPNLSYHTLMLNGQRGPLRELEARQAIACAIDRRQVIKTAYFGYGEVTGPITSPAFPYDPAAGLPCDPPDLQQARQLLAEAGYGDGFTLETIVMVGQYATATAVAQSLQAQLEQIGVQLELRQQQTSVYVENWLDADFEAAVALNGGSYDPYLMYGRYFTGDGSLTKPAALSDSTLNRLLRTGKAASDPAKRQRSFRELQRELLHLSPWVWLLTNTSFYLVGPEVTGFQATPDESLESLVTTRVRGAGG